MEKHKNKTQLRLPEFKGELERKNLGGRLDFTEF